MIESENGNGSARGDDGPADEADDPTGDTAGKGAGGRFGSLPGLGLSDALLSNNRSTRPITRNHRWSPP
ncbi:hypothetical protein [Candidatus Poriferisodalis sp.]|uniref:hypothetical protein n=1 Tax=Candidatus Poriferisodalis sp. TaxID=3101277 RepID=UPI003B51BCBF